MSPTTNPVASAVASHSSRFRFHSSNAERAWIIGATVNTKNEMWLLSQIPKVLGNIDRIILLLQNIILQ